MGKKKLVILTGAGVSAESGLKTFRDSDGLWEGYKIEDVATPGAWKKDPALVLEFYNMRRRSVKEAKPNRAHLAIAELEKEFDVDIITQNIDDLHERAGSSRVLHLHGEIFKMQSDRDESHVVSIHDDMRLGDLAPGGGQYRPAIVWFEEPVPKIADAIPLVRAADIFVVVGTSLVVYPAAGLVNYASGNIPKFIVDKTIPFTGSLSNLFAIEKPATEGMDILKEKLKDYC